MPAEALSVDAVVSNIAQLRRRHDDLNNECTAVRAKLTALIERTSGFVPTRELEASRDDDAADLAALEAELEEVEAATEVANHDHATYKLMIKRLHDEATT